MKIILFLFILFFNLNNNSLQAQTPSDEITPTQTVDDTNDNEDIQKIREVVQQKVKEKLAEITTSTNDKKAFIGTILDIDENNLTISYNNQQFKLQVSADTIFIDAKRNKTSLDEITPNQAILAMGYLNESQILETKRLIIVSEETLQQKKHTIIGKIVDISQETSVFVLIPHQNKDNQYQIKTDSKTKVMKIDKSTLKSNQLENGQTAIVIFSPTKTNSKTYYAHQVIKLDSTQTNDSTDKSDQ